MYRDGLGETACFYHWENQVIMHSQIDSDQVLMHASIKNITRVYDHLVPITSLSASPGLLHDKNAG